MPIATPCLGDDVAKEVLQWIGAFRQLTTATIVSFNMQDYEFWGNGRLSSHLLRQLAFGAHVVVMTTPPSGATGTGDAFRAKLSLLEDLDKHGAHVYLNERLHAKAYLFQDSLRSEMTIVGSPNLTARGFGTKKQAHADWIELALLSGDNLIYSSTLHLIQSGILAHQDTVDFATWIRSNRSKVATAKGV